MLMLVQEPHLGATAAGDGSFLSSRMEIKGEKELGDNSSLGTKMERKQGMKTLWYNWEQCAVI